MNKEINDLVEQFRKTLMNINSGTVNIRQMTETFNDHIDRIMKLEERVAFLESKINNQQVDTVNGANQDLYIYR